MILTPKNGLSIMSTISQFKHKRCSVINSDNVKHLRNKNLYTIVLDYKKNTHVYQLFARNEIEANLNWIKKIDLHAIGAPDTKEIKEELTNEAMTECFYPKLLNGMQCAWCSSVSSFDDNSQEYPAANIIATVINENSLKQQIFKFSKSKVLYTIQLDYKNGTYFYQILANDVVDAKIKWIKQLLNLNVIQGAPENIQETKENLLAHSMDQDFIPNPVDGMYSVWSTFVKLGDELGRVTIVATQTNVVNFKHDSI